MSNKSKAINSETFCMYPFIHFATTTDGGVRTCCRGENIGNIKKDNFKNLWNNEYYKNIRKELLTGNKPEKCFRCWNDEENNIPSMRQRSKDALFKEFSDQLDKLDDQYNMPFEIKTFEAKLSNLCNLKCRMCSPLESSSLHADWKKLQSILPEIHDSNKFKLRNKSYINDWYNKGFWDDFKLVAPHLSRIDFAGGEPLIDPSHYKVMDLILPYTKNISLDYSTNLSIINYKKNNLDELWQKFKNVELSLSIDGIDDIYNYIRQNGNYDILKSNIKEVQTYKNIKEIRGHCTFQIYNIFSLPEIFDAFVEDLNINIFTYRVLCPPYLDMRIIPTSIKDKLIKKLQQYKDGIENKTHPNWTSKRKQQAIKGTNEQISHLLSCDLHENLLEEFVSYSDNMDKIQNVKYTWRELLPELKYV
tara:strand:+ start:4554 stop:5807 length:1254 start_codon:yes stop_codon:yes gene_type:complete